MKKVVLVLVLFGTALLGLAIALPAIATSNTNIIGGADLSTFLFHFRKTSWLAIAGLIMIVMAMINRHK